MMNAIHTWIMKRWRWYRHRKLYVIADPTDNSITLSKTLFKLMDVMKQEQAKVYVFHLCNAATEQKDGWCGRLYAFTLNPTFGVETQLADVQYNDKYHTIGFESLCPTVNRIFYDYGLPVDSKVKLSVEPKIIDSDAAVNRLNYYIILPPYDKPVK